MTRTTRRVLVGLAVLVVVAGWLGLRSLQVYSHLQAAREVLGAVQTTLAPDTGARLGAQARAASADVRAARNAADDPVFWLAAHVPVAGRSFALARGAAIVSEQIVDQVLAPASMVVSSFQKERLVQGGRIDVALLEQLDAPLRRAAVGSAEARRTADALPSRLVPGVLLAQRRVLVDEVDRLDRAISAASTAVHLAPDMLGRSGVRRYFIAVQNNAETRGTGGLIGAYAVVRADRGRLTRERVGSDADLQGAPGPVVDLGKQYADHYDQYRSREDWRSAVLTPEWPSAAATIAGLWTHQSGQVVDGVIGLDPRAMADVLSATGPVQAGGRSISGANVVDFVLRDEYALFATRPALRKPVLGLLAGGIFDKVVSGAGSSSGLLKAFVSAASSGHLQLWSRHAEEQSALRRGTIGGRLPDASASLMVSSVNAAGSKLDYYVRRTVGYVRTGKSRAVASVTLLNTVDAKAVPDFVKSRIDRYGFNPTITGLDGSTRQILTVYGGNQRGVFGATVNGSSAVFEYGVESGHPYATTTIELKPGVPVRVDVTLTDFGGTLIYRQQPLVVDDTLRMSVPFRVQD